MEDKIITKKELQEVIEHFRDEIEKEYNSMGEEDGFEWAKSADIEELRSALEWDPDDEVPLSF